jgi:hypothetical protein
VGLLDSLLGRTKLEKPSLDRLFQISTARITLDTALGLAPAPRAALCFKPMASARFRESGKDVEDLARLALKDAGTTTERTVDEFGYEWLILRDKDFEDLVTAAYGAAQTLIEEGFGDQLLCAVFRFGDDVRFIYNVKRGLFYPFVSAGGKRRDSARELELQGKLESELKIEPELERWFPLWDAPV